MLFSLLGSSLLNAGLGGGTFKDAIKNIGLGFAGGVGNAIPSLLGSQGRSGLPTPKYGNPMFGRALYENSRSMARIGLLSKQRNILSQSRARQGTISAYLASRGFGVGGSTARILSAQNMNHAMEDIELSSLETKQKLFNASVRRLEEGYTMMNDLEAMNLKYENPYKKFMRDKFINPTIDANLSSIGKTVTSSLSRFFE